MITNFRETYTLGPEVFREALEIIERSGAAELIDEYRAEARGAGGRPPTGPIYNIKAVLVAALTLLMLQRTPSEKGLLEAIANFTEPLNIRLTGVHRYCLRGPAAGIANIALGGQQ